MKKLIYVSLCAGLVACGGGSSTGSNTSASNSSTTNRSVSQGDANSNGSKTGQGSTVKSASKFTLAVIPDTQFYSQKYPSIFRTQTRWIADNYKQQNIKFTAHLGDVVQNPEKDSEWLVAVQAMSELDKNPETPYSILAGNHDITGISWGIFDDAATTVAHQDANRNKDEERFTRFFSIEKQEQNFSTLKGADETGLNSYHIFADDEGQEYMVLALDWRVSDKTIKWAKAVMKAHSTLPVIFTTHELLDPRGISEGAKSPKWTSNGKRLWNKLIKDNDQIFLTFNGHWNGEGYRLEKNAYGRDVLLVGVDYQNEHSGGNGMLQLVEFDKQGNKLNFRSYSPYVQEILDLTKHVKKLKKDDKNILNRWVFSIPVNFQERFTHFNQKQTD